MSHPNGAGNCGDDRRPRRKICRGLILALFSIALLAPAWAQEDSPGDPPQASFETPEQASAALLEAARAGATERLIEILGPGSREIVVTSDPAQDQEVRETFVRRCEEGLVQQARDDGSVTLVIGKEAWPFPIPLVKDESNAWRFDTATGREEVLNRRIGVNELHAIDLCRYYVTAQAEYASEDRDGDGVREYAQRLPSTRGQHDGLYWETDQAAGETPSPLGKIAAEAADYAERREPGMPWYGYRYRILTRQGDHPPGGAYNYVIGGNMIAGFALIAYPADHGSSGVMTFVVSHQGRVYEKDLGPATAEIVGYIHEFDPDDTWRLVEDE